MDRKRLLLPRPWPAPPSQFVQFVYFEDKVMTSMIRNVWQFVKIAELCQQRPGSGFRIPDAHHELVLNVSRQKPPCYLTSESLKTKTNATPPPPTTIFLLLQFVPWYLKNNGTYIFPKICSICFIYPIISFLGPNKQANFVPWWWTNYLPLPPQSYST